MTYKWLNKCKKYFTINIDTQVQFVINLFVFLTAISLFLTCLLFIWQPQRLFSDRLSNSGKNDTEQTAQIELENKIRATWIQAISGLGLFVAAYSAWLNYQSSQKNLKITDSKQITERFSKAVEQLGNESITIRLGGIFALERIAKDSKDDHWTIMEVLTAFVREKSDDNREPDSKIPQDIQAALTVIGRRNTENDLANERLCLNNTNLSGAELRNANFSNIYFAETKFNDANLYKAKFNNALLYSAEFRIAYLLEADFTGADIDGAKFIDFLITSGKSIPEKRDLEITVEQILKAKNWNKAHYSCPVFQKKLKQYLTPEKS